MNIERLTKYAEWLKTAKKKDIWAEFIGCGFEVQMPIQGLPTVFPSDWGWSKSDWADDDRHIPFPELKFPYGEDFNKFNEDWSIPVNNELCYYFDLSCIEGRFLFCSHDGREIQKDDPKYPVSPKWNGNQLAEHIENFIKRGGLMPSPGDRIVYNNKKRYSEIFFKDESEELEFIGYCYESTKSDVDRGFEKKAMIKGTEGILIVSCYYLCEHFNVIKQC